MIILRKYTDTEKERKALVEIDKDIACVDKRIATLKNLLDTRIEELENYKAKLYYEKLLFAFPKVETLYEDTIIYICGLEGLEALRKYHMIESCALIDGRKLYVI